MKLNDPFGRVNRKHHTGYLALRDRLQQQGVADTEQAAKVASGMLRAAVLMLAGIGIFSILWALALPRLQGVSWMLGGLLAIWVVSNYFQARMHLKRYVLEECCTDPVGDDTETKTERL